MKNILILFFIFLWISSTHSCQSGYINGTNGECYYIPQIKNTWFDAECDCQSKGGHLASAQDAFTNQLVSYNMDKTLGPVDFWLGGYGNFCAGDTWNWENNANFGYTNWNINEPILNYIKSNAQTYKWRTDLGDSLLNYICEFQSTVTTTASICALFPLSADCGKCWTKYTNACYYAPSFYNGTVFANSDWMAAESVCNRYGAHLVSIHTDDENTFILNQMNYSVHSAPDLTLGWIGLFTNASYNISDYRWTDATTVDYLGENSPFPDGYPRCVYMNVTDHHWHDTNSCGNFSNTFTFCKKTF